MVKRCPIPPPRTSRGDLMVENGDIEMIHLDLLDSVIHLINAPSQRGWCQFRFEAKTIVDDMGNCVRVVDELWTGDWWRLEELKLSTISKMILAVGIATDETTLTMTGRKLQPIYAFSYNYGEWWRSKESGWMLIGMLPIVRPVISHKNSELVRKYRRLVHRWQMAELMSSIIRRENGLFVNIVDGGGHVTTEWMYPRFPFAVADEPEMKASFVGAKVSSTSTRPCNVCLVKPVEDTIYVKGVNRISAVIRRLMPTSPTEVVSPEVRKLLQIEHSLHVEYNVMWSVPGYDPFWQPGCILHQLDSGVFEVILERAIEWLRKSNAGADSVREFDRRWALLCEIPGGKLFRRGVSSLANVSMAEHRLMTMGLPFVLHGMTDSVHLNDSDDESIATSGRILVDVAVTYLCWRWCLSVSSFSGDMLTLIDKYGRKLIGLLELFSRQLNGSDHGAGDSSVKVHKIVHWTKWIALFGCPHLWSSETFESAHKLVKMWRGSISWKHVNSVGPRAMQLNAVYNAHADSAEADRWSANDCDSRRKLYSLIGMDDVPSGWLHRREVGRAASVRKERWGVGQFRGRVEASVIFDMSAVDIARTVDYERHYNWFDHPNQDAEFILSLETSKKSDFLSVFQLLSNKWTVITSDMDVASHPNVSRVFNEDADSFTVKLLIVTGAYRRGHDCGLLLFWNKMWISMPNINSSERGYYVKRGMFIYYSHSKSEGEDPVTLIGRVEFMASFAEQQVLILRRTIIKRRIGDACLDATDFIARHRNRMPDVSSKIDEHFRQVTLKIRREGKAGTAAAYHIIVLGKDRDVTLGEIASMQPDFSTEERQEDGSSSFNRYFEMDYVVLWN